MEAVPSLSLLDAWRLDARYAFRLLAAAAANAAAGSARAESAEGKAEEKGERFVGPTGVRHAPGVSRMIRGLLGVKS
jgi:hypothetical protein